MVVKHNLSAMNSNRMLGLTTATLSSSTEKLSSGYKINRAADDAAGLAISEKSPKGRNSKGRFTTTTHG
jgi:flagellin